MGGAKMTIFMVVGFSGDAGFCRVTLNIPVSKQDVDFIPVCLKKT